MPRQVTVVGLGPGGVEHLTGAARHAIESATRRFARTARHPAVAELDELGFAFESLDHCYEEAATFDDAYERIVDELVAATLEAASVVYAVPGSPTVAERTPRMLDEAGIEVSLIPGVSFADLAWARLGVDPLDGVQVVDGRMFAASAAGRQGRLLIAQCDSEKVLSDVKLALGDVVGPSTPVTVLAHLGLDDEEVRTVALEDLDREVAVDHLTSLYVDAGAGVARPLVELYELVEQLRGPGGCPWDAAQTHHSLSRHTLEEAYEVVEAVSHLPADAPNAQAAEVPPGYEELCDELGDLLFQVLIHSVLAREAGAFELADVASGIHDKLVRRHPHVFGSAEADTPDAVVASWEQIKKGERGSDSLVAGIPESLPSLLYVAKLLRKAESIGLDPVDLVESGDFGEAGDDAGTSAENVGRNLAAVVVGARRAGFDAEVALRAWATRLRDRFSRFELRAAAEGVDLAAADPELVRRLWVDAG